VAESRRSQRRDTRLYLLTSSSAEEEDDDDVYSARGPLAQRALLLIYYVQFKSVSHERLQAHTVLLANLTIPAVLLTLNLSNAVALVVVLLKGYSLSV
jgi:hypothetical protein